MILSAALGPQPWLRHAFFTRAGGVSDGIYAGMNCGPGSNDDPGAVRINRQLAMQQLGVPVEALCSLYQVHGREVVRVTAPLGETRPKADGMVTNVPGLALGILTADCAPVLFADSEAQVIGACHAGWRGALLGMTDATIDAMVELGASVERIGAAIGPTIAQASYEVGPEFPGPFLQVDESSARFFAPSTRPSHFRFDLPGYLVARLTARGLGRVENLALDTLADDTRFFSFRRTTLRGEKDYGRQLSAIVIAP